MRQEERRRQERIKPESEQHQYDDIIDLPHHVSLRHPQMPLSDRAAQFAPFAALAGHDAAIRETARRTDSFAELDDSRKEQLNERLQLLGQNLAREPEVEVVYFQSDPVKHGGTYVTVRGKIKKVDGCSRRLLFTDGRNVSIDNLFSLEGEIFDR